jgi:hypothetical protein
MTHQSQHWYDEAAGPMVRLFALTRGRARPVIEVFDLLAMIHAERGPEPDTGRYNAGFSPEQAHILELSQDEPRSVVDLAADCDLPIGVLRVILSDLLEFGHVRVSRPVRPDRLPDEQLLKEVINGLRAL